MLQPGQSSSVLLDLMEIVQNPELRRDLNERLGDYCHQYRNRLNSLKLSLYLAQRQAPHGGDHGWRSLEANYQLIESLLDRVQTVCQPFGLCLTTIKLGLLFEDRRVQWSNLLAESSQELVFPTSESGSFARFDVNRLGAALDALVAWRGAQGAVGSKTTVSWLVQHGQAQIQWSEQASTHYRDLQSRPAAHDDWALPILARVVQEHGGQIELVDQDDWILRVIWPTEEVP